MLLEYGDFGIEKSLVRIRKDRPTDQITRIATVCSYNGYVLAKKWIMLHPLPARNRVISSVLPLMERRDEETQHCLSAYARPGSLLRTYGV